MSKKKGDNKGKNEFEGFRLAEGTAADNLDTKSGDETTAVHIKNSQLKYEIELKKLQIELMKLQNSMRATGQRVLAIFEGRDAKLQNSMRATGQRVLAIFEGRDAAGKGGTIKRITANLNPRSARVVALMKPNETEMSQWYFQRYVTHLPSAGEIVIFDRSWYNRAMVEPVMGFCTDEQNKRFLKDVPLFEEMLVKDGIKLFKFYFSVSKEMQKARFDSRKEDPLKQYKLSPVDNLAQELWDQYSVRKFQMLSETNRTIAPWTIIRSDDKKKARLNCMKHILSHLGYDGKLPLEQLETDSKVVVSGIEELKHMETNLMRPEQLHG